MGIQIKFIVVTPVPLEFNKDESQARNLMADNLKAAKLLRRARKLPKLGISSFLIKLLEAGGNHVDTSICRAASATVSVMADGSMIMPCMHYPELKVNLNTGTTAEEVWYSEKAMEVRQMCGRYPYCEGCLIICLLEISRLAMPRNLIRNFASILHDLSMFKKQLKIGG